MANEEDGEDGELPALDFSTFVLSLGSSCMIHLGKIEGPEDDTPTLNLPAARQIIDIISILSEKSKGNLDESEAKLLQTLLYDLRVQFVDAQKSSK